MLDWTRGGVLRGVPQGSGYVLEVQGGAGIARFELTVGIAMSAMGQSNMFQWFRSGGVIDSGPDTFAIAHDGTVGQVTGLAARIFTSVVAEVTGAPVGIINTAVGNTSLTGLPGQRFWLDQGAGTIYEEAVARLALVGGTAEVVLWAQGEADVSPEQLAAFRDALATLFERIESDFGDPLIAIQELAPVRLAAGTVDLATRLSRIEDQRAVADALEQVIIGAQTGDATLADAEHLDTISRAGAALHMAVSTLAHWGYAGVSSTRIASDSGEILRGSTVIDFLHGGVGDDVLLGGGGRDELKGGAGRDALNGGLGDDILRGQDGDDTIRGFDGNDIMDGGEGADVLRGEAGHDELWGGAGADVLDGGTGRNSLWGGDGNDMLRAGANDERLRGEGGIDTISYALATDAVTVSLAIVERQNTGGAGGDILSGFEKLVGSRFADRLAGDALDNTIRGGDGDDVIDGGAGNDILDGNSGLDRVSYASAATGVTVDLAITTAQDTGGGGRDVLRNFDQLTGSAQSDTLRGDAQDNAIDGGGKADRIDGRAGNDRLSGGHGSDTLTGGEGADIFVFRVGESGVDTVTDFGAEDTLNVIGTGLSSFTRVDGFGGIAGQYTVTFDGQHSSLSLDIDGDGDGDLAILFDGDLQAVPIALLG